MNNAVQSTGASIVNSVQNLYDRLMSFLPQLVAALVILLIGWTIATALGRLVSRGLKFLKVDDLADRAGFDRLGERMGKKITISGILGWLVKWFFLIATFVATTDALRLNQVSQFLYNDVFPYFGNVVVAVIILVIGFLAANFLHGLARNSLQAGGFAAANTVANVARWAILVFAFIAALAQLRIAADFMRLLFAALVFMLALAGGLAFGLGGRDQARDLLDTMRRPKKT